MKGDCRHTHIAGSAHRFRIFARFRGWCEVPLHLARRHAVLANAGYSFSALLAVISRHLPAHKKRVDFK